MTAAEAIKKALKATKYVVTPINSKKVKIVVPQESDFEKAKQEIIVVVQPIKLNLSLTELTVIVEQHNIAEIKIK